MGTPHYPGVVNRAWRAGGAAVEDAIWPGLHHTAKTRWQPTAITATLPEAVRENEEVVPVNAFSTWVLPSRVTVGR